MNTDIIAALITATATAETIARTLYLRLPDDATREQDEYGNWTVTYGKHRFFIANEYDYDAEKALCGWSWVAERSLGGGEWVETNIYSAPISEIDRLREAAVEFAKRATA